MGDGLKRAVAAAKRTRQKPAAKTVIVEMLVCRAHGYHAVSIDNTRITPEKCCGSWQTLRAFVVDASTIEDAITTEPLDHA
jgi:hypothetical protein